VAAYEVVKLDVTVHVAQLVKFLDAEEHLQTDSYRCFHPKFLSIALNHQTVDVGAEQIRHNIV
jgi:hypothetical protein